VAEDYHGALMVWRPFENMMPEDESVVEGYLELACSPSVGFGGRNKELAIHYLFALGGSIKVSGKRKEKTTTTGVLSFPWLKI